MTHSWVLRVPHAYPVHDLGYAERFAKVRSVLDRYPGLRLLGRTGAFSYRNVDGIVEDCFRLARDIGLGGMRRSGRSTPTAGRWA